MIKNPPASAGDTGDSGSIPALGRYPGEGNRYPSCLLSWRMSQTGGAWWATVHRVTKNWA